MLRRSSVSAPPFQPRKKPVTQKPKTLIRVGHSPDSDDAFMFFALAKDKFDTGDLRFTHELVDIETLNRRAFQGDLELTAISVHAYAYLDDKYLLCNSGASMGDRYGPMLVAKQSAAPEHFRTRTIAVPGTLTTAYLALRLCLNADFSYVVVPFDQIVEATLAGEYQGRPIDAGLIIHEGQLTYDQSGLQLVVDLGVWWHEQTGLPLPLGANGVRKDLASQTIRDVDRLLQASIRYGLEHRDEALDYALAFGRGLDRSKADRFVAMYVNEWTLDFGAAGREAVATLLRRGFEAGVVPRLVTPQFVAETP
jgi:1,4-dihydroxy-6-naphthoate synthase